MNVIIPEPTVSPQISLVEDIMGNKQLVKEPMVYELLDTLDALPVTKSVKSLLGQHNRVHEVTEAIVLDITSGLSQLNSQVNVQPMPVAQVTHRRTSDITSELAEHLDDLQR